MPLRWVSSRQGRAANILEPLPPRLKWRAITLATLLLVPAYWGILGGLVALGADDAPAAPNLIAGVAFGLALIPFVFIVLAFLSQHPRAPGAVLKAMGLTLVVGIPVLALAADAVTGLVAGIGCGGVAALRSEAGHSTRARFAAVAVASVYAFVLVRVAGPAVLLTAPILPFTAIGIADHLVERKAEKQRAPSAGSSAMPTMDE
jgi:hypothetical protein